MKTLPPCLRLKQYFLPSCKHLFVGLLFSMIVLQELLFKMDAAKPLGNSPPEAAPSPESSRSQQSNHSEGPSMLLPSSPIYPILPNGTSPQPMSGVCSINISAVKDILQRTAGDCTAPLAMYVGNVICCPQFTSMLRILGGASSFSSGFLAFSDNEAIECLADISNFLVENGGNSTTAELCNVHTSNLTHGLCPVWSLKAFEQAVDTRKLLDACTTVDPLRECCNAVCQPAITDAAVRLASNGSGLGPMFDTTTLEQVVNDCEGVVLTWLARELGADVANSAFRILSSCRVNRVCPLELKDVSSVVKACSGASPIKAACCSSLNDYISFIQQQMLITNVQALECVTLFGAKLQKEGVVVNVYNICEVDLKDFSLQVHGDQGCLLRSNPSDVMYDNVSGISFTCDLNDNIPAPWPSSSSVTSFPLCANRESLPALPVLDTSESSGLQVSSFGALSMMTLNTMLFVQGFLL